jgi:Tol biopolymer transport system component
MTRIIRRFLLPILPVLLLLGFSAKAQVAEEEFGRNRLQYKTFKWQYYSTPNFDVYYYGGGKEQAHRTAEFAEKELKRVTSLIGYYPYSKITLLLYNSVTDLRQSNIGLNDERFPTGGDNLFLKNKIEIPFEESQVVYKKNITYRLCQQLLNDMMYGGSLKEVLQSSYLLKLPDWFISGVSAYIAEGWSVEMDGYMRDMMDKTQGKKPETIFLRNQRLAGQSVWNYIAERYGYTSIQNILNLTRITRDIEIGISSSLNVPYRKFMRDWNTHYLQINTQPDQEFISINRDNQVTPTNRRGRRYSQISISPDGNQMAYVVNDLGRYRVVVRQLASGREKVIKRGGYKTPDQKVNYNLPVIAWRGNTQVGVVEEKKGYLVLNGVHLEKGKTSVTNMAQFSAINSMRYSDDGKLLVMSAVKGGQSDLFLFRSAKQPEQLTNDIFDDRFPVFLKESNAIAFSSNRWLDSLGAVTGSFDKTVDNNDIFLYFPDRSGYRFRQLTATISNETQPVAVPGGLVYISEESGIRSLHRYNFSGGQSGRVSNFLQNIETYDFNQSTGNLAFTGTEKARQNVYLFGQFTATVPAAPFKTVRQETLESRSRQPIIRESVKKIAPTDTASHHAKTTTPANGNGNGNKSDKPIDVKNYQFGSDQPVKEQAKEPVKEKAKTPTVVYTPPTSEAFQPTGPFNYDLRFSIDNVISSIYEDNLMGFGLVGQVNMSDLFEDHRIRGGVFATTDLRTSNFYGEYSNLRHRYDYRIAYRKQTIFTQLETDFFRFSRHEFKPSISYPLTHNLSVRALPQFTNMRSTAVTNLPEKDSVSNYGSLGGEVVFDNSIITGVNMMEGTRMKVGVTSYKCIGNEQGNFGKFYADLRHYQKLHKQLIWANRAAYGAFFGNDKKQFLLGGMDNWLFPSEEAFFDQPPTASDVFFLQFATNLRGFPHAARRGPKYLLYNSEVRLPIVQYLFRKPVYSGFFNNLQLTAFFDAGTAYSGRNPFNRNNSVNTQVIGGNGDPFEATVTNFRNPFLMGYGFGARTTLLGVYGKLDLAWSRENNLEQGPRLYLTMGYDF